MFDPCLVVETLVFLLLLVDPGWHSLLTGFRWCNMCSWCAAKSIQNIGQVHTITHPETFGTHLLHGLIRYYDTNMSNMMNSKIRPCHGESDLSNMLIYTLLLKTSACLTVYFFVPFCHLKLGSWRCQESLPKCPGS
jgi:hypothetical protein